MLLPKKRLGQNFLRDENIARKIVASLQLRHEDAVVEIGSGNGALTKHLAGSGSTVIGIELDEHAVDLLREQLPHSVRIIQADVLTVDLRKELRRVRTPLRIVGNIPYYITSDILFWLFRYSDLVGSATLMLQLEVARRLVAPCRTKEYGILSVFTRYYAEPEILFKVSRNSFHPVPKVDSAVVQLTFRRNPAACNRPLFANIVRATFGTRRKTLRNGLRTLGFTDNQLAQVPHDLGRRPETLTAEEYVGLTRQLEPFAELLKLPFPAHSND